jgi:alpha-glucosidase
LVVELNDGKKLCITEADLESYPGLYLNKGEDQSLRGVFAPYPKQVKQGGHNMLQGLVTERENYIAKCKGSRSFPWRVFAVSTSDKELLDNDLVYLLAESSRVKDTSWIKPGKVAWEWWNDWNIYGVNFKSGINNDTYKYYIDFASKQGIEYVILDEGWAVNKKADLLQVVPQLDIQELVNYGKSRNVGIILWAGYWAIDRDMENVFKTYSDMGVRGFKVDFMDRDDQAMVDFYYRCAETAAKYHLMIDYHGAYKPTGLHRTYPNVINFEGVYGLEQLKWAPPSIDMVTYDVTMPYIRMLAGPLDYTQGAMRNATKENYRPINSEPMSQGTRCRQLAEYVIFESPLNMLCDSPSNYLREPECTRFISEIPTIWDQTLALDGTIGEYIVIARRKDDVWYVGGLTNWNKRNITVDLSFLDKGNYEVELFSDGVNADRAARDYKRDIFSALENQKLSVTLMPGGGFAAKIKKK